MAIGGYSIGGYWVVIILVAIRGYFINGYW